MVSVFTLSVHKVYTAKRNTVKSNCAQLKICAGASIVAHTIILTTEVKLYLSKRGLTHLNSFIKT